MNIDNIIREEIARLNETAGKNMPDTFFDRVVQKLGGTPTAEKRKFFRAWKRAEGTDAKNNPLATTLKLKTSHGGSTDMEGSYNNGQPVQDYKTMDAGVDATFWTLKNTYRGKAYQNLVDKLKSDDVTAEELAAEKKELATWSMTAGNYVAKQLPYVADQEVPGPGQVSTKNNDAKQFGLDIPDEEIAKSFQQASLDRISDKEHEEQLDKIQRYLDYGGFIPFIGDAVDALNGVLYFARNKPLEGILSFIAVIPGVGSAIAVPLKLVLRSIKSVPKLAFLASKNGVSWLSKNVFKNPLFTKLVLKKYGPDTLKQMLDAGEPFLRALNDLPTKLNGIPILNRLASKGADPAAKVFKNFLEAGRKTYDDMLAAASSGAAKAAVAGSEASLFAAVKKYGKKLGRVKLNKLFGGKTIDAFVKFGTKDLDQVLSKNIINKIVTRVARNPEAFQQLLRQVDFDNPNTKKRIKEFLEGAFIKDPDLAKLYSGSRGTRLTQRAIETIPKMSSDQIKRLLGDTRMFNSKFRKQFLEYVTTGRYANSTTGFRKFNKVFRSRAGIQAEKEMADITNFFRGVDVRGFFLGRRVPTGANFWDKLGKLGENINAPKIFTKLPYILDDFEKMQFVQDAEVENSDIKLMFDLLKGQVLSLYANKFYQIPGFLSADEIDEINERYKNNLQEIQKIQSLIANDIASGKEDYTEGDLKALELAAELTE